MFLVFVDDLYKISSYALFRDFFSFSYIYVSRVFFAQLRFFLFYFFYLVKMSPFVFAKNIYVYGCNTWYVFAQVPKVYLNIRYACMFLSHTLALSLSLALARSVARIKI